jgi:DNA-binding transcriptional ArsR family regulator
MTDRAAALTALGDPTRRAIFERIARRPSAVGELADEFPVSRPAVSQHLKVLKEARLVRDHADGTRRIYEIDSSGLAAMREYFDQFWQTSLASFKDAAERSQQEEET